MSGAKFASVCLLISIYTHHKLSDIQTVTLNLDPPTLLGAYFKYSAICSSTFSSEHPLCTLTHASEMNKTKMLII